MRNRNPVPVLVSVVAPVYNEERILETFLTEVREALSCLPQPFSFEIVLVNDGSTDGTTEKLNQLVTTSSDLKVIHLCRNFGHGAAISAGLKHARGEAVILMDSDLQDDPAAFSAFFQKWLEGYSVVYAVRASRKEGLGLQWATAAFYKLLSWISNTQIPQGAGTFSLMDRRVVKILCGMPERNRFWPGLRAWAGFAQTGVPVERRFRYDRRSRVGVHGLWCLSMNAIFSFSYFPILIFRAFGVLSLAGCLLLAGFVLYHKVVTGNAVTAWASQMLSTLFFGGINLLGIGVVGEYVARIYDQLKGRPEYVVDRVVSPDPMPIAPEENPPRSQKASILWAVSSSSSHR